MQQELKSLHTTTNIYVQLEYCVFNIALLKDQMFNSLTGNFQSSHYKHLGVKLAYFENKQKQLIKTIAKNEQLTFRFGAPLS